MATKSHKPIVWGLFAAGGTIAAFLAPVLIVMTSLMPLAFTDVLSYERVSFFVQNWLIKIVVFGVVGLQLWHAAHRLRVTAHDFGIRADTAVSVIVYALAGILTIMAAVFLILI